MKPLPFDSDGLKETLERALGFRLQPLKRLGGGSSFNFKAVRVDDGYAFVVKCIAFARRDYLERLVSHLHDLADARIAHRVFVRECPESFVDYYILCLEWCAGASFFPDQLSEDQFRKFLADYQAFSTSLQSVTRPLDPVPALAWKRATMQKCKGLGGMIVRRLLRNCADRWLEYSTETCRIIHNDLHHGNFVFADGHVQAYFDLEELRWGYPAEDLVRYIICAKEHTLWFAWWRGKKLLRRFETAVRTLPYSRAEWRVAIHVRLVMKVILKTGGESRIGFWAALNIAFCARYYSAMLRIVGF